jgi:uncharacterized protein YecT (DUF1311 family)
MLKSYVRLSLVTLFSAAAAVAGCEKPLTPQQVCAAPDTLSNIEDLVDSEALKEFEDDTIRPDALTAALKSLWANGSIKLGLVTLKSIDHDTKKISCEGQIAIKLSDSQQAALLNESGGGLATELLTLKHPGLQIDKIGDSFHSGQAVLNVTFSRQPSADGKSFVFSYESSDPVPQSVRLAGALQTLTALPASPSDQASADTPVAVSSAAPVDAAAPSADNGGNPALQSVPAHPSFDCSKASSVDERMICSNSQLAAADVRLMGLYRQKLASAGAGSAEEAGLKQSQRDWIKNVRSTCSTDACLAKAYDDRLNELGGE